MKIKMAGIDYRKAPVQVREQFSMTASMVERALKESRKAEGVTGCVIISTCNRTEYWISGEADSFYGLNPAALLCREKELDYSDYASYFVTVGEQSDNARNYYKQRPPAIKENFHI